MCKVLKILMKVIAILSSIVGILFVIYFWNLDQKVLGWCYQQVNRIYDRKKMDIKF